ncbi:ABC transporter permease [Microbacterium sp. X-17]|uniref:ABC transporter permease n=1 Tax=Microbacterium sp. X-17 TaxID=3144404 RepID=UPI0031F550E4
MSNKTELGGPADTVAPLTVPPLPALPEERRSQNLFVRYGLRFGMIWVLVVFAVVASILYTGFLSPENVNNMVAQVAPVGIIALGMTFVIIGGGFDLSVAAIFAAASVAYASLSNVMDLVPAFILTVILGVACGVLNGIVITVIKVNPFIATLSTASLFSGATYVYSQNLPVISNNPSFGGLGGDKWGGIWISVWVLVGLGLIAGAVLSRTTYGRSVYSVGGNSEAARLTGMRVKLVTISTYMLTGGCAAVAGMITASQIGVGQPTLGANITLDSIAIVIIGGTSLLGGEGAIWRTAVGLGIWAMINNLFSSLAISTGARLLMVGAIVLVAVALDSLSRRTRV